jgi:cytochrome c1
VIRDPKAVRTWPQQQMTGFDKASLPDAEVEAIIAFLTHMAAR